MIQQILAQGTQLAALLVVAGCAYLARVIAAHVKRRMVANALETLADLAGHAVNATIHAASAAEGKPDVKALEAQALASLQATGSQAIATLLTHGGFTQAAVDATLGTLLDSARAQLYGDAR